MIDSDAFGLKDFSLVESSEAGMVSQVSRAARRSQWIVYLGWAPHPMNSNVEMEYLSGGDDFFGPNYGGANVYTNVRSNYLSECSNVGQLLQNLEFTLEMEKPVDGSDFEPKCEARESGSAMVKQQSTASGSLVRQRKNS